MRAVTRESLTMWPSRHVGTLDSGPSAFHGPLRLKKWIAGIQTYSIYTQDRDHILALYPFHPIYRSNGPLLVTFIQKLLGHTAHMVHWTQKLRQHNKALIQPTNQGGVKVFFLEKKKHYGAPRCPQGCALPPWEVLRARQDPLRFQTLPPHCNVVASWPHTQCYCSDRCLDAFLIGKATSCGGDDYI